MRTKNKVVMGTSANTPKPITLISPVIDDNSTLYRH